MTQTSAQLVYDLVNTQFIRNLHAFKNLLNKAKAHAEVNKFDPNKYLDVKFAPDMFNFLKQVQILSDNAKGATARLTGSENPSFPDTEQTFEELYQRIDKTIDFIAKFKASDYEGYDSKQATFPWYPTAFLTGHDYLVSFALPNFYFHLSTAYGLLRTSGVSIGKSDYLGEINWQQK